MIRLILLLILVLFVAWILRSFLRTKDSNKTKDTVEKILDANLSNSGSKILLYFNKRCNCISISCLASPKFGINFLGLL